jgi:predicted MFS family arabinose efflux permease
VTNLALPLIAALTLHASPFEMGLLSTIASLPNLLIGLFAGTWADHARRRPIMIIAHVIRTLLLVSISFAAGFSLLSIQQLYAALFLFGICTTFFDVAQVSYLPSLIEKERLLSANSRLVAASSIAGTVGPGLGGVLVQLLTAPLAILVDVGSLALSAILLLTVRSREPEPAEGRHRSIWQDTSDGLRLLYRDPLTRSIAGASMIYLFFNSMVVAVYVLYATRDLAIAPAALGVIFGVGGAGAVLGAGSATRVSRSLGIGPTMIVTNLFGGLSALLIPLAGAAPFAAIYILGIAQGVSQMMGAVFYINQTSLLQAATPDNIRGRIIASYRFLTMGAIPVGSLLGGILGETIGLRVTLIAGGVGILLSVPWLVLSPVRTLHTIDFKTTRFPDHPPVRIHQFEDLEV